MHKFRLTHLHDTALLRQLARLVTRDRANTALLVACIAEVDERQLYLPAGYASMHAYCLGELHLSEDAAYKRIRAARAARRFPILLSALSDGRLHLSAVCLLALHFTPENVDELVAAAKHKCRAEVERWLADRFPLPEALRLDDGVAPLPGSRFVPDGEVPAVELRPISELAPGSVATQLAPGPVQVLSPPTRLTPVSPDRYALQITIPAATHEKLRHAQALLGHSIPSGDIASVLDRALDALIGQLEKRKVAATRRQQPAARPARLARPTHSRRHVPAQVRRTVWERDGGRCTFVGERGHRCGARARLEFDHADPVARGGRAIAERMRLLCRAHNKFEAERVFGKAFMRRKRAGVAAADHPTQDDGQTLDVIAGLRALGMGAGEARRLAAASSVSHPVTLEERLRLALKAHRPRRMTGAPGLKRPDAIASEPPQNQNAIAHSAATA